MNKCEINFFIIGAPRSGTTWLNRILNSHPDIFTIPSNLNKFEFSGIIRLLKKTGKDSDWEARWAENSECWDDAVKQFTEVAYTRLKSKYGIKKNLTGIKTPLHCFYIDHIARIFPETKFIFIYRDGRDVALSMKKKFPKRYPLFTMGFLFWEKANRAVLDSDTYKNHSDRILSIKYEDLCQNPVKHLSSIAQWLDVNSDFDLEKNKPVKESVGKWKRKLWWWQKLVVKGRSDMLKEFGYKS